MEANPSVRERHGRSGVLMTVLLVAGGLLVLISVAVFLVPLSPCPNCLGHGEVLPTRMGGAHDPTPDILVPCHICAGRGKVTPARQWRLEHP